MWFMCMINTALKENSQNMKFCIHFNMSEFVPIANFQGYLIFLLNLSLSARKS